MKSLIPKQLWEQLAIATNWPVLVAVGVLCALGVVSIHADNPEDAPKQLMYIAIGVAGMALFQAVNYQKIGRWAWVFYVASLLLVIYTVLPGVPEGGFLGVPRINGARAWIDFKFMRLEPAELLKLAFVLVLARYLRFRSNYRTFKGLLAPFATALIPVLIILKQPDLGMALCFMPALFAMLFVAGARTRHLLIIIAMGVALMPVAWLSGQDVPVFRHVPALIRGYQRDRVKALLTDDPSMADINYQQERALIAMGTGGIAGQGLGNIPVGRRVPESHNDMIFALIGEQFGFIGSLATLMAYIILFAAGVEIAGNTKEPFGRLIAIGIVSLLAAQTFINLLVCTRLMPVTGITLPFASYGGSSLLASFLAVGLLLNVGQNRPLVMARAAFEFD